MSCGLKAVVYLAEKTNQAMKPIIKLAGMLIFASALFSSCHKMKDITREQPITLEFLSGLEPGKRYEFELKIGQIQTIYVTGVDDGRITGYVYPNANSKKDQIAYSDSFENIVKSVAKISVRKTDPLGTSLAIIIPVATIIGIAVLIGESMNLTFQ